ncbi:MAG: hypothetical protein ACM3NH_00005, partial [Candidatus Saccharibacteria bacterium]
GITDGYDTNGDGNADYCLFGGTTTPLGPPCKGSGEATTPPADSGDGSCVSGTAIKMPTMAKYGGEVRAALDQALADHPAEASAIVPTEEDPALATIKQATIANLQAAGFDRVGSIANCSSGRVGYDTIMVAHSTDIFPVYGGLGEIYDIFRGAPEQPISQRAQNSYVEHGDFGRLR